MKWSSHHGQQKFSRWYSDKESAASAEDARDQGSIAESERFPGEGNSSPLYSLVAQSIKCLPAMQETQVRSLDWKDPLEKRMATHFSILAWRIPWTEEPGGLQSVRSQSWKGLSD